MIFLLAGLGVSNRLDRSEFGVNSPVRGVNKSELAVRSGTPPEVGVMASIGARPKNASRGLKRGCPEGVLGTERGLVENAGRAMDLGAFARFKEGPLALLIDMAGKVGIEAEGGMAGVAVSMTICGPR